MAILMLFGAGASYGSEPDRTLETPPLGIGLFPKLAAQGGFTSTIPEEIAMVFKRDFEEGMALFNERMSGDLQEFHRELSLYLASFTPTADSFYIRFLRKFGRRNVVVSSLNYDMMLEEAAMQVGLGVQYQLERNYGYLRIVKPHGSLNFWPDIPYKNFRNIRIYGPNGIALSAPVKPLDRLSSMQRCVADDSFSPAISMYAKGKRVSVCPEFVKQQQLMFKGACRRASRIILVGVRVVSEDQHIWSSLAESSAQIIYFGSDQDALELNAWSEASRRKNLMFVRGFFESCLSFMEAEL